MQANRYGLTLSKSLGARDNAPMETAADRRRRKLTELCNKHGLDVVAIKSKQSRASLDQVIKGTLLPKRQDGTRQKKALGNSAARAIERAFSLGTGWFDTPDVPAVPVTDELRRLLEDIEAAPQGVRIAAIRTAISAVAAVVGGAAEAAANSRQHGENATASPKQLHEQDQQTAPTSAHAHMQPGKS